MSIAVEVLIGIAIVVFGPILLIAGLGACLWSIALLSSPAIMLTEGSTEHFQQLFGGPWPESKDNRQRLARRTPDEIAAADKWTCGRIGARP